MRSGRLQGTSTALWTLSGCQDHVRAPTYFVNLWLTSSSTANLQTPYLLNTAVLTTEFLPQFHNSTRSTQATFRLLSKLDYAFSSLLTGHDFSSGEILPGFDAGRSLATTDKVRLKGIVDRTRLTVVRVLSGESVVGEDEEGTDSGDAMDTDANGPQKAAASTDQETVVFEGFEKNEEDDEDEGWEERNIGSIYEKTIGELGDVLGGPPIGIITDDWNVNSTNNERRGQGFVESGGVIEF